MYVKGQTNALTSITTNKRYTESHTVSSTKTSKPFSKRLDYCCMHFTSWSLPIGVSDNKGSEQQKISAESH